MATIPRALANFSTSLASKIADTGVVSFTLSSVLTRDGSNVPAGTYGITIDEGKSNAEHMIVTISGTTATIVTRGLSTLDGTTNVPALQFEHRRNAVIKMTNHPLLIRLYRAIIGTDTLDNKLKYTTNLTFTDEKELIPKKYADDLSYAGAPDGSTTTKGVYELATDTEALDGTASGTTTAPLVPSSAQFGTLKSTHTDNSVTYRDTILAGNLVWYDTATDGYKVALATTQAHIDALAAVAYDAGVNGNTGKKVLFPGSKVTGASGLTKGAPVYLSDTGIASAAAGTIRKVIGRALSATVWIFNPTVETPTATASANALPRANASGKLVGWVSDLTNNSLTTGEAIDGSSTPQVVCVAAADGLIYKADGNTNTRVNAYGFITTNALITTQPNVTVAGILGGFAGLTKGAQYYVSDAAGSISTTPSTTCHIPVGRAISATQIELNFGKKVAFATATHSITSGVDGNDDQTVTCGFRPSIIEASVQIQSAQAASTLSTLGRVLLQGVTFVLRMTFTGNINSATAATTGNFTTTTFMSDDTSSSVVSSPGITGSPGNDRATNDWSVNSISDTGLVSRIFFNFTANGGAGSVTTNSVIKFVLYE